MGIKIERKDNSRIRVTGDDGGFIESQTVEANIQFAILEKLEEIRICVIDVECEIGKAK